MSALLLSRRLSANGGTTSLFLAAALVTCSMASARTPGEIAEDRSARIARWMAETGLPRELSPGTSATLILRDVRGGRPIWEGDDNDRAALSINVTPVRQTSEYGNLSGAGVRGGLWESGDVPRASHVELVDSGLHIAENDSFDDHATHVAGTLMARGVLVFESTRHLAGMAPGLAELRAFNSTNDLVEMAANAATGLPIGDKLQFSNHSYSNRIGWDSVTNPAGFPSGTYPLWTGVWGEPEDRTFGLYDEDAEAYDTIAYQSPYYLPFKSASNDRGELAPDPGTRFLRYRPDGGFEDENYNPAIHPGDDAAHRNGYETVGSMATAKNVVTVGAITDAVSMETGLRDLLAAQMTIFSTWGPTDDGRIKPDLVTNGNFVSSCGSASNTAIVTLTGTSMSTPGASGACALILEQYARTYGGPPLASTAKALMLHTVDDLGNAGPDYQFGFGLLNVKNAIDLIRLHEAAPALPYIVESTITSDSGPQTLTVFATGEEPLRATLVWTDPPAGALDALNPPDPRLIHDLDLELRPPGSANPVAFPWILDPAKPAEPATRGIDRRNNVEKVEVFTPPVGMWEVRVSVPNPPLAMGEQRYSLVLSGIGVPQTVINRATVAEMVLGVRESVNEADANDDALLDAGDVIKSPI